MMDVSILSSAEDEPAVRMRQETPTQFLVGTQIPCGATSVALPEALGANLSDIQKHFEDTCIRINSTNLLVGDVFVLQQPSAQIELPLEFQGVYMSRSGMAWHDFKNAGMRDMSDPTYCFFLVEMLVTPTEWMPTLQGYEDVNLIDVPHSIRRSLMQSEPIITWSQWSQWQERHGACSTYLRVVQVTDDTPMRHIWQTIKDIEGWSNDVFYDLHYHKPSDMQMTFLDEQMTVAEYFVSITNEVEPFFPCICWSSLDEERGIESDYEMEDEEPSREHGG